MFMYILLLLEMSVCTSGRFLNFPCREQLARRGKFISAARQKEFYQGSSCPEAPTALCLCNWSKRNVKIHSSHPPARSLRLPAYSCGPGAEQSSNPPRLSAPAYHAILIDRYIPRVPINSGVIAALTSSRLDHREKRFLSAALARGEGAVGARCGSTSCFLSWAPSPAASIPCCTGRRGARRGNNPLYVTGNVNKGLFTNCAVSKRPGCAIPPREVSWRTSSAAVLLRSVTVAREHLRSWFSRAERDRQIQMHTPQQISTNGTPQTASGKSGWPAENGIAQMPLRTPPSSTPRCCRKMLSLLPTNVFPAGPAIRWPQALYRDILLPDQQHLQGDRAGGLCSVFGGRNVKVMNLSKLQFDGQGWSLFDFAPHVKMDAPEFAPTFKSTGFWMPTSKSQLISISQASVHAIHAPRTWCALALGKGQSKISPACTSRRLPWVQAIQEKCFSWPWDTWREGGVREGQGNLLAGCAVQDVHSLWKQRTAEFPFSLPWQPCSSLAWWSYPPPLTPSRGVLLQSGSSPLQIASSPTCLLWSLIHLSIYTVVNQD